MKTKHFLFTAALLSAFSACTNDDFMSEGNTLKDDKGILVEVGSNFAIAASKGNDAETRAYDKDGKFVWLPQENDQSTGAAILPATLGLCWTGINNVNAEGSALAVTDHRVFTNYKFEHKGWLYEGESVPDYDICTENQIKNGEFLPGGGGTPVAKWSNSTYTASTGGKTLDLGTGFFKSNLGTIYQGEYIVYFPYSDSFFNSPIVATAPKTVELSELPVAAKSNGKVIHDVNSYEAMSKYGFNVGYSYNMDGGVETQSFTTKSLSGGVVVRLTNSAESLASNITTVTLYSKNKQFILKQELSAAAIKAAGNDGKKYGKDFYYGEPLETSKTVVAKVGSLAPIKKQYVDIVIPVLPASIDDLKVLLTNEDNKTAEVTIEGVTEVKSVGQGWTLLEDIDLKGLTFNKVYAMDAESFRAATNNVSGPCSEDLAKAKSSIVRILGHIEIDQDMPIAIRGGYTIEGEEGDALILKSGNKVNLDGTDYAQNRRFIVNMADADLTKYNEPVLDCDVIVEDAGCCNKFGTRLVIGQATIGKNAHITVMGHEDGVTPDVFTKDGWLSFDVEGTTTTINGTIVNDGQITFGRTDRKETEIKAQSLLNGSITNNKGMTIFYAGSKENSNDDAKLAVSSTGILNNETGAEFTIEGELFFDGTGHNNGTIYDRVSSQVTGKLSQYQGGVGEYVCDVNNPGKRFSDALTSVYKPTTIVRFVEAGNQVYDFTSFVGKEKGAYDSIKKYIVAVGNDAATYFKGENITLPAVEVEKGNTLNFKSIKTNGRDVWTNLTVTNDLVVDGTIVTKGVGVPSQASATEGINTLTVNNDFIVNGKAELNNKVVNVAKTWYIGYANGITSTVEGTTVYVGSKTANGGLFDIQGVVDLENNTDILVYGDVNAGKKAVATILEATGTAADMPATVTYTGKNTYSNILTNWPKGGPSMMM